MSTFGCGATADGSARVSLARAGFGPSDFGLDKGSMLDRCLTALGAPRHSARPRAERAFVLNAAGNVVRFDLHTGAASFVGGPFEAATDVEVVDDTRVIVVRAVGLESLNPETGEVDVIVGIGVALPPFGARPRYIALGDGPQLWYAAEPDDAIAELQRDSLVTRIVSNAARGEGPLLNHPQELTWVKSWNLLLPAPTT